MDQGPGQNCEFVHLRSGVHEVAVLLICDASPYPRRKATGNREQDSSPLNAQWLGYYTMYVESSWNVMARGDAREGKWRGNWRMGWVASTLHTTWEHVVSSITTADAHTSTASSRMNCLPRRFKWTRPFRLKTKSCFCVCRHISNAVYSKTGRRWKYNTAMCIAWWLPKTTNTHWEYVKLNAFAWQ